MSQNPHLKAIFPYVSGDDDYCDRFYSTGGAMKIGHRLLWLAENMRAAGFEPPDFKTYVSPLPVRRPTARRRAPAGFTWQSVADHPSYDQFWKDASVQEHLKDIHVPVYSVGAGTTTMSKAISMRSPRCISITRRSDHDRSVGACVQCDVREREFGKDALVPLRPEQLKWFDRWLKGKAEDGDAQHPVRFFVMGVNQWRDEDEWPLARARNVKFYLDGQAGSSARSRMSIPRPTRLSTIREIRCLRWAERSAATRVFFRGGRWTSGRWRSVTMCSCIRPRRWPPTWK